MPRLHIQVCLGTAPVQFELVQAPPEVIIRLQLEIKIFAGRVCPHDIKGRGEETDENDCLY